MKAVHQQNYINRKSTKPIIDFFDTEVGIAMLTIICLLIAYNVHYRTMSNLLWDKVIIDIRGVAITLPQKRIELGKTSL